MDEALEKYLSQLIDNPLVRGVLLFGSRARGNARPDSDYDLLIIWDGETKRGVNNLSGRNFELVYATPKSATEFWSSNLDDCYYLWQVAKILFDRDGTMKQLEKEAKRILAVGKKPISEEARNHFWFDAKDSIEAAEQMADRDRATANLLANKQLQHLAELYFDLRGLWTPPPKQMLSVFRVSDAETAGLLEEYLDSRQDVSTKITLLRKLLDKVFQNP